VTAWRYTDQAGSVAVRSLDGGVTESCLVSSLPPGVEILPAYPVDGRPAVLNDYRTRRETYLDRLAGIAVFTDDQLVKAAAKVFRQTLLDIPANPAVTGSADAAAMQAAILTLYITAAETAALAAPAGKVEFDRIAK
jgi:hypothetical protein